MNFEHHPVDCRVLIHISDRDEWHAAIVVAACHDSLGVYYCISWHDNLTDSEKEVVLDGEEVYPLSAIEAVILD
eukprot:2740443-Ditylum_brightwellii.AAC.1